jgi:hypothetical protein
MYCDQFIPIMVIIIIIIDLVIIIILSQIWPLLSELLQYSLYWIELNVDNSLIIFKKMSAVNVRPLTTINDLFKGV